MIVHFLEIKWKIEGGVIKAAYIFWKVNLSVFKCNAVNNINLKSKRVIEDKATLMVKI